MVTKLSPTGFCSAMDSLYPATPRITVQNAPRYGAKDTTCRIQGTTCQGIKHGFSEEAAPHYEKALHISGWKAARLQSVKSIFQNAKEYYFVRRQPYKEAEPDIHLVRLI